jgi:hypothetical protein
MEMQRASVVDVPSIESTEQVDHGTRLGGGKQRKQRFYEREMAFDFLNTKWTKVSKTVQILLFNHEKFVVESVFWKRFGAKPGKAV